ncbi:sensor histidine kinase [Actinoplanes sp. TBRC 11911]|uniref:sensor histidine kinase n=1 Tax=Actinoplanes sp. TBRC 11911 TaxID=2729386 RepID=UPI00145C8131|nr:sensor histidine kinase [Actinoplanes sp. TBRC 11911]NMO55544.1 sensor histidine kinase [Actinoplanes sp. TBRC 11911]
MKSRHWSIRSKIIALISVPLVALLALWAFATVLTAGPAINLLSARTLVTRINNPGQVLVSELQRERRLSVEYLATPGTVTPALTAQRAATDRAVLAFRQSAGSHEVAGKANAALHARLEQMFLDLNTLPSQRLHVDRREVDAVGAQGIYNETMDAAFEMFAALATFGDENVDREIDALSTVGEGQEYLARVDSLLAGATVAGKFDDAARSELVQDVGTGRFLLQQGVDDLPEAQRTAYQTLTSSASFVQLNRLMDTLVAQARPGAAPPVTGDRWHDAYATSTVALSGFESDAIDDLASRTTPIAVRVLLRLGLAGALGLVALIISVLVSIKVGRSIVGRLRGLRGEALEMATERLPNVVRRLQRGEEVDVNVETPPLAYGLDEIGELGQAFNDVQRTAVQSAVEEASVRRGLNEVFLNIARRSQTLLHRQLALLDKMERRETEPQELEDLYRVDHLATRMRRHAEDLVILAGAAPGRGWRNPVPVIDVVRGAISEVEDYRRVDIRTVATASVLGRAVGDIIHLLAELLENAASFSPPHTRVQVSGQVLPNGYAVEIEDRGLGMTLEAIDEVNRRLVEPPEFDPSDSARLGLFVVAQLANRHGIRVALRSSAFGGVTAIVFIPGALVTAGPLGTLPSAEQPLVGSGSDDPARHSLAALQWQGTEELRQVTVSGRATTSGEVTRPIPRQRTRPALEAPPPPAPAPVEPRPAASTVAAELSVEGLVQRRRVRRPVDLATSDAAAPAAALAPTGAPVADTPADLTEDGLPRRRRQANLAPQLRRTSTEQPLPDEDTVAFRSPEQVRSIMTALQRGTTKGRLDAAKIGDGGAPDPGPEDRSNGEESGNGGRLADASFADAATVSFPAIVNFAIVEGEASTGGGTDAAGDRADGPGGNEVSRPEKDAE